MGTGAQGRTPLGLRHIAAREQARAQIPGFHSSWHSVVQGCGIVLRVVKSRQPLLQASKLLYRLSKDTANDSVFRREKLLEPLIRTVGGGWGGGSVEDRLKVWADWHTPFGFKSCDGYRD